MKNGDIKYKEFTDKSQLYSYIRQQLYSFREESPDTVALLANAAALLKLQLNDVNWAGFYLLRKGHLVLGPFQGKPAVAEIDIGQGVCGTAVQQGTTQLVDDVHSHCNHIACDLATNSEMVVPIFIRNEIFGVIDIDSPVTARFDAEDKQGLEQFADVLAELLAE